jgi:hypothetical protein
MNQFSPKGVGVAVALLGTWTVAEATPYYMTTSLGGAVDHAQLIYQCCGSGFLYAENLGSLNGGSSARSLEVGGGIVPTSVAMMGISRDTGSIVINVVGGPSSTFAATFGESDAVLKDALLTENSATILGFATTHFSKLSAPMDTNNTVYRFTIAFPMGTFKVSAVPEPSSVAAVAVGLALVVRRRRR